MKRFKTIDVVNGSGLIDYSLPEITFGKSLVDRSGFIPMADAVSSLTSSNRAHVDDSNNYDFADGVDTGLDVSMRHKGIDIAEHFQNAYQGRIKLEEAAKEGARRAQREKSIRDAHKAAVDNSSAVSGDQSGTSSGD